MAVDTHGLFGTTSRARGNGGGKDFQLKRYSRNLNKPGEQGSLGHCSPDVCSLEAFCTWLYSLASDFLALSHAPHSPLPHSRVPLQHQLWLLEQRNGNSLVVQWLRLHPPNAGGLGSIPGTRSYAATKSCHITTKDFTCQISCMLQGRLKILCATVKTQNSQIYKINKNKY